jgi:hypothetical protein
MNWGVKIQEFGGGSINEVGGSKKCFVPIFQWHGGGGKKSKIHLNNVSMFALDNPILLVSTEARNQMRDPNVMKEGIKPLILAILIGLNIMDFTIELPLHKLLKFMKIFKHLRFTTKQINPCKLVEIVNKGNIIFLAIE